MKTQNKSKTEILLGLFFAVFIIAILSYSVMSAPVGVEVTSASTDSGPTVEYSRAGDDGGTITTLLINQSQQTEAWKGYVGNITGQLVLRDSYNYSIYDWQFSNISGEVYASRASSITWASVNCMNVSVLETEYSAINMVESDIDSINKTFNDTIHRNITVGGREILNGTCPSIATFVNNSRQGMTQNAVFQEVVLEDETNLVYATLIEPDLFGYNENRTFDFQMIVADSDAAATQTTYYFFAELG